MRSMRKIKQLFHVAAVQTPAPADDAVFEAIKAAYIETRQSKAAQHEPMIWSLAMRSPRTRLAAAAVVAILGAIAILLWQGTGSGVALADVLARMDHIDAYTCEAIITHMGPEDRQMKSTAWISRDYGTKTVTRDTNSGEVSTEAYVLPKERTAIVIEHDKKTYMQFGFDERWADVLQGEIPDPRRMLVRIQTCNYTSLGISTVDGVEAEGFRTTDPNYIEGGTYPVNVSLWVDVKTGLPLRSEEDIEMKDGIIIRRISHDFQWNVPIDPSLFQPFIPDGYANASGGSLQIPAMNEEATIRSLKLCLELGGRYPIALSEPALEPYTTFLPEFKGMTNEQIREYAQDPNHRGQIMQKRMPLMVLLAFHRTLAEQKREPVYYGDTVTPQTPHAVLMRWKLDDGRYRVIFGDLKAETVTSETLALLEKILPKQ